MASSMRANETIRRRREIGSCGNTWPFITIYCLVCVWSLGLNIWAYYPRLLNPPEEIELNLVVELAIVLTSAIWILPYATILPILVRSRHCRSRPLGTYVCNLPIANDGFRLTYTVIMVDLVGNVPYRLVFDFQPSLGYVRPAKTRIEANHYNPGSDLQIHPKDICSVDVDWSGIMHTKSPQRAIRIPARIRKAG